MSRAPALIASVLLHAGLLAAFVAWPDKAEPPPPPPVPVQLIPPPPPDGPEEVSTAPEPSPEPPAAAVEPAPASEPPPPTPQQPTPQPPSPPAQPEPPRPEPPVQRPRPAPPAPRPAPKPTPAPPAARPAPKPTPPRPAPPRPAPPKATPRPAAQPKEAPLDLGALGQRLARNQPAPAAKPAGASPGELASARAELRQRLQRLWRPNCGPDDALAVNVRVRFRLRDGRIQGAPELIGGTSDDPVVRAAQERALAAVRAAAPFEWLPEEMQTAVYDPITFNAEQACG